MVPAGTLWSLFGLSHMEPIATERYFRIDSK